MKTGKAANYQNVKRLCVFGFAGWPKFHLNKGSLFPETSCPGLFLFPVTKKEKLFAVNSVLFSTNESFYHSLIESTLINKHVAKTFQVSAQPVEAETGHETPLICVFCEPDKKFDTIYCAVNISRNQQRPISAEHKDWEPIWQMRPKSAVKL